LKKKNIIMRLFFCSLLNNLL